MTKFLDFPTNVFSLNSGLTGVYEPGSILFNSESLYYVRGRNGFRGVEQIGQVNDVNGFNQDINENISTYTAIQFLFVNEEEKKETPEKSKTLKIQQRTKILERTIKIKTENFWKNVGWKTLKSFKSLLS